MKIYIAGKITGEQKAEVEEKFRSASCKLKSEMASVIGARKGNLKIGIGDGRAILGLPGIQRKREESEGTSLRTGS